MDVCLHTPATVNGTKFNVPTRCTNAGAFGMWGQFDLKDLSCPHWDTFQDWCGDKVRLYEAQLLDIPDGMDWQSVCESTPATIAGIYFHNPVRCVQHGVTGMFGRFQVSDLGCRQASTPTCTGAVASSSASQFGVNAVDKSSRCMAALEYLANSQQEANQCAQSHGYDVADNACEYYFKITGSNFCQTSRSVSDSSDDAQVCLKATVCQNCTFTDITSDVVSQRAPGACTGGTVDTDRLSGECPP
jgi:hypothetical protein